MFHVFLISCWRGEVDDALAVFRRIDKMFQVKNNPAGASPRKKRGTCGTLEQTLLINNLQSPYLEQTWNIWGHR